MNQVDNIIFQNFLSIGWEKEENNEINSLQDLEVSEVAKLMVKCLTAINQDCELPESLPHNMSQRFRAAAQIAESIKDLGYSGDLGYQSILYSNEADLRRIFTFLIEKLPKDAPTLTKEPLGKPYLIQREVSSKIEEALSKPWVPPHCSRVTRRYKAALLDGRDSVPLTQYGISHLVGFKSSWHHSNIFKSRETSGDLRIGDALETGLLHLPTERLLPTLLNCHSEMLGERLSEFEEEGNVQDLNEYEVKGANNTYLFTSPNEFKGKTRSDLTDAFDFQNLSFSLQKHKEEIGITEISYVTEHLKAALSIEAKETRVDDLLQTKEKEAEKKASDLNLQISHLQEEISQVVETCKQKEVSVLTLKNYIEEEERRITSEEKKLALLRKTASLASDPESSLERLKLSLEASKEREEKLKDQWVSFKDPLEEELKTATLKLQQKRSKQTLIQKDIDGLRRTTQALVEEAKSKEELFKKLQDQQARLVKGVNRAVYTKQILDISAKVKKQKQEIQKILSDTRVIQKEINTLTGKLQRTFAVVENASFKAASANEQARPVYRSVISIHDEFAALIDTIRNTGNVQREIADLHQQLNSEKSKNIEDNVKKLQEDFNKLKTENATLKKSLNI